MAHKVKITGGTGALKTSSRMKHPRGKAINVRAEERKANKRIHNPTKRM